MLISLISEICSLFITFVGMKVKVAVIGLLVMLVAVVAGCGGAHRYDSRLVLADSLMQANPDSALVLVEAVDADSLSTEGDRAYRDLLLTQARYKCYITATSDSAINRALAYYRHHKGEREKLTRTYIYKGAVMEELNHPDSAMFYYKTAEATADPKDYANLGYVNLRIGQLYQSQFINDSAVVARMRNANYFFQITKDTSRLITTSGTIGIYYNIIGKDSARFYLNKAISLAKAINSPKGYQYQSKLAGLFFYDGDYRQAKDLAMDIYWNGKNYCNENQFYYYATRSYIRLHQIDSAMWLATQIPNPSNIVDSLNHYQLLAEFALETRQFDDYVRYEAKAKSIDAGIMETPRDSKLTETELNWDSHYHVDEIKNHANIRIVTIIGIVLLVTAILSTLLILFIKKRINIYRKNLSDAKLDLEKLINDLELNKQHYETELNDLLGRIAEKDHQLTRINKEYRKLEKEQDDIHERAAAIVRERNAALNELYDDIRLTVQAIPSGDVPKSISLSRLIKDYHENKAIRLITLKESFWKKLKSSVDLEFNGIATYVERNYPQLTVKDFRFFCLLCANISPRIIMLCMNYGNAVTVSKYKSKFISKKIGINVSFDEFIDLYLQGRFTSK